MIGFKCYRQRAVSPKKRVKTEDSQKMKLKGWSIGKDVQAYFSNRLVVLLYKSKGIERQGQSKFILDCSSSDCMVCIQELNASEPLWTCRK